MTSSSRYLDINLGNSDLTTRAEASYLDILNSNEMEMFLFHRIVKLLETLVQQILKHIHQRGQGHLSPYLFSQFMVLVHNNMK